MQVKTENISIIIAICREDRRFSENFVRSFTLFPFTDEFKCVIITMCKIIIQKQEVSRQQKAAEIAAVIPSLSRIAV